MKGLLTDIDVLISHVTQRTNGSVSWRTNSLMVVGGEDRFQSLPANTVAKYLMSSFGIKIYMNKIAVNNQHQKQTTLQEVQKISYLLGCN
jgi:hypothetical protein